MSCPYFKQCYDFLEGIKCKTCMHSAKRSYYVEYHEYPPDKWPKPAVARVGDNKYSNDDYWKPPWTITPSSIKITEYPSPTSIEWPYLPSGDDLRFPVTDHEGATHGSAATCKDVPFTETGDDTAVTATLCKDVVLEEL